MKNFGAKGDGVTDDSAAINAAISYIRNADDAAGTGAINQYELYFPQGKYIITSTVNLTCFSDPNNGSAGYDDGCRPNGGPSQLAENHGNLHISASGVNLVCKTSGTPCIDGLGSRYVHISGLTVAGSCNADEPNYGVQIGMTITGVPANSWYLSGVLFKGCFSKAAYYNRASENTTIDGLSSFTNGDPNTFATDTGPYAAIWDSDNHWEVTSAFVNTTIVKDTPNTFNDNKVVGSTFEASGGTAQAGGLWIYGTRRLRFIDSYIVSNQTACINIYYDATSGGLATNSSDHSPEDPQFDIHCEGDATKIFQITGAQAHPIIKGLHFADHAIAPGEASASVFALDAGVTALTLINTDIDAIGAAVATTLWDTPSAYTVSGNIRLPAAGGRMTWAAPGSWTGCVWIGSSSPSCGGLDVTGFINTDQFSGYKQAGNLILYASSTPFLTFGGIGAGASMIASATSTSLTSSPYATAFGYQALGNATSSGYLSTAFGYQALKGSATVSGASANSAFGVSALPAITTGSPTMRSDTARSAQIRAVTPTTLSAEPRFQRSPRALRIPRSATLHFKQITEAGTPRSVPVQ